MNVMYNDGTDLLYIRFDNKKQEIINKRISDNIVLDIGTSDKIVGIEILNAPKNITLDKLLPVEYKVNREVV